LNLFCGEGAEAKIRGEEENGTISNNKIVFDIADNTLTTLCQLSSVWHSKFYIPGETNEEDWLRRKAIESGLLVLLDLIRKKCQIFEFRDIV
jgi:hypothetical protein